MPYLRQYNDYTILVVLNMSNTKQQPTFTLTAQGLISAAPHTMLVTTGTSANQGALKTVTLEPYGVFIAKLYQLFSPGG